MLYSRFRHALCSDNKISAVLEGYERAIHNTSRLMFATGVTTGCTACAREAKGSCCFYGMEDNFDQVLLLINLLLGRGLPTAREVSRHCYFLGSQGCKLIARYHFCVNYFCAHLKSVMGPASFKIVLAGVGAELSAGWEAEQAVDYWLRGHTSCQ